MKQYYITKPVRLIELFSGISSQAMALKTLGVEFEHYITSEWEVNAVKSAHAMHFADDTKDYSKSRTKDQIIELLCKLGISNNGKDPMTKEQVSHKSESWLRNTLNDFVATRNIGSIVNRKGGDLRITNTDKYEYILTYSFP